MGRKHRRLRTIRKQLRRQQRPEYTAPFGRDSIYLIEDAIFMYWLEQAIEKEREKSARDSTVPP